ncbi:MAG TPA: DUF3078 domain-containing protein [Bacteroidia bacterium]|nr:DUF3078 domain-containing protein [Bacteroidia bacterium]
MKKATPLLLCFLVLRLSAQDSAPKDTSWKTTGLFGLNFAQTQLSNWAGGGQNNIAINSIVNYQAIYQKEHNTWESKLDAQFGVIRTGESAVFKKNLDQLLFLTKYNHVGFSKHWFYAAQADYRTQFAPGYIYKNDSIVGRATSDINSPGYIQALIGLDYKPVNYFSMTFSPLAGKITIVDRQYLADEGAYGVKKAEKDPVTGNVIKHGEKIRFEVGGRIVVKFKKEIVKNVTLDSYLDLFSNYQNHPENIDVVFNNLLSVKLAKYFSLTILSQMLYDNDIITIKDVDNDGKFDSPGDVFGPRLQMMNTFALGFSYRF